MIKEQTISKSERIVRKFEETVDKKRELDSDLRSIFSDMRSLLSFSERKLDKAKDILVDLRERINKVIVTLHVFKGLIQATKDRDKLLY